MGKKGKRRANGGVNTTTALGSSFSVTVGFMSRKLVLEQVSLLGEPMSRRLENDPDPDVQVVRMSIHAHVHRFVPSLSAHSHFSLCPSLSVSPRISGAEGSLLPAFSSLFFPVKT